MVPCLALLFGGNAAIKAALGGDGSTTVSLAAGAFAGMATFCVLPLECTKQRLFATYIEQATLPRDGRPRPPRSAMRAYTGLLLDIIREEGVLRLYRGAGAALLRSVVGIGAGFAVYDAVVARGDRRSGYAPRA
jgi:hypothetical protein